MLLVDALAREKSVPKEIVFGALESALASATKRLFAEEDVEIRVAVDRESGEYDTFRRWHVVPDEAGLQEPGHQIILSTRATRSPTSRSTNTSRSSCRGRTWVGRIAQDAKQVILQKIRDAEREQLLTDFLARNDSIVNGTVKRMDKGDVVVEIGEIEGAPAALRDDPQGEPAHRRPRARLRRRRSTARCAARR